MLGNRIELQIEVGNHHKFKVVTRMTKILLKIVVFIDIDMSFIEVYLSFINLVPLLQHYIGLGLSIASISQAHFSCHLGLLYPHFPFFCQFLAITWL